MVKGFNHVFKEGEDGSQRNFIPSSNIKEGAASFEVVEQLKVNRRANNIMALICVFFICQI